MIVNPVLGEETGLVLKMYGASGALAKVLANAGTLRAPSPFTVYAATSIWYVVSASSSVKTTLYRL